MSARTNAGTLPASVLPLLLCGGLAVLALVFGEEGRAAVRVWNQSSAYGHCFLVLPIAAYLAWDRRHRLAAVPCRPAPLLLLAAPPLGLAWLCSEQLGIMEGRQLVVICFVQLLAMTVLGWRMWRALAAPLLYLFFLVPFGAFATPDLQSLITDFVRIGLDAFAVPNFADGFTIEIPEGRFHIAEACAGLRFLIATLAFGALYAVLMFRSPARRICFVAACAVVPVGGNGLRALGIVLLAHIGGRQAAADTDHVVYGWVFCCCLLMLLTLAGLPFRDAPERAIVQRS